MSIDTLARTIYGEARGEPLAGRVAVANVVMNRVRKGGWWGDDIEAVCKKPWQFSCWNDNDPNKEKIESVDGSDPVFAECLAIANLAASGFLKDLTDGATNYHTASIMPTWARKMKSVTRIASHIFYRE